MDIASITIKTLTVLLLGYFWYDKRKIDEEIKNHKKESDLRYSESTKELNEVSRKQTEHDNKFVTDQRVRSIVQDEIKPLKEDVGSMKVNVARIMESLQDLTIELKVQNALRDQENKNK